MRCKFLTSSPKCNIGSRAAPPAATLPSPECTVSPKQNTTPSFTPRSHRQAWSFPTECRWSGSAADVGSHCPAAFTAQPDQPHSVGNDHACRCERGDRKSPPLNSSHHILTYAVF